MLTLILAGDRGVAAQTQPGTAGRHTLFPPTDLGLLESPDRDIWQKPEQIMDALGIADGSKVADIGAGGGYFTVRLSRRVGPNGIVWAEDVQPAMLEAIKRRVAKDVSKDIRNVQTRAGHELRSDAAAPARSTPRSILETYQEIQYGNPLLFLQNVRAGAARRAAASASSTTRRAAADRGRTAAGRTRRRSSRWPSRPAFACSSGRRSCPSSSSSSS